MKLFHLTVVTPDGTKFDEEAQSLIVRTSEGDIQILAGHMPFFGGVAVGPCKITDRDGNTHIASCSGGFLAVGKDGVNLVPVTFEYAEEIDLVRAKAAKERAQNSLKSAKNSAEIYLAEAKLMRALSRISVAERK